MKIFNHITLELNPAFAHLRSAMLDLPRRCCETEAELIYNGRNRLWRIVEGGEEYVVKEFRRPNIVNRFVYGVLRASKAKRSFDNALELQSIGVGTPTAVGYLNVRSGLLFDRSYYVSLKSECPHTYCDVLREPQPDDIIAAIARQTATMHNHGLCHKDYSRGNILYGRRADGTVRVDVIDLNRMRRGPVDIRRGCDNIHQLPATPEMHRVYAEAYAAERGYDADECLRLVRHYRSHNLGDDQF